MAIVSKVTRFFLLLGAVSIGATGFKYIQGSRNGTLATGPLGAIFEPEIFNGYYRGSGKNGLPTFDELQRGAAKEMAARQSLEDDDYLPNLKNEL